MKKLLFALAFPFLTFAQSDQKSQDILDKLSKDIKSLKSFSMDFTLKIQNPNTGENDTQQGTGIVKGDKFNAVLGKNEIVSNGFKIWTIIKEEKVVYESDADDDDEDAINPKRLMTIWETGFKNKYAELKQVNGKQYHVINLYPTKPGEVQYHTIKLFVDAKSNDLYKAEMKTKDGSTMNYEITNFKKNIEVDNAKFIFDARKHPGYQLIRD